MPINKDLLREFAILIFLYFLDLGTDFAVVFQARNDFKTYKDILGRLDYKSQNGTDNVLFCSHGPWVWRDYDEEVGVFGSVLVTCWLFLAISCALLLAYIVVYIWMIYQTSSNPDFIHEKRDNYTRIKFAFGFTCSMLQNIPMACLAVDMYTRRSGSKGLVCWECAQDDTCTDKGILQTRFRRLTAVLTVSLFANIIVSLYKGVTTFYRWTKVKEASCYELRACVSLFVGCLYALVIVTPSLALFKYSFFSLPVESGSVFAGITDSLFMIGLVAWAVFVVVAFCCPLIRLILM